MGTQATATFKIEGWDENAYLEGEDGRKLTRASVKQSFAGDIEGEGSVEWLMCYRPDETADFVGLQQISGRLGERSGSFVLQSNGVFDGKEAKADLTVVDGSGTDDLAGITGQGEFRAPVGGGEPTVSLDYGFEA
jgi:Protein of unknown function (DUF3224)